MKSLLTRAVCLLLCLAALAGAVPRASAAGYTLTDEQKNAIAMLNHMTVLTQETNASKNSRLFLEQVYASLVNNIYPNAVDSRTLSQMDGLLDTMERYRMITVQRDRLQYIYEQNQAQVIRAAVPNPLGMRVSTGSDSLISLVSAVVYMAIDSYTSYLASTKEAEYQFLSEDWALRDEEAQVLHQSRKDAFGYMVKMVNDYGLPGELCLTEETVRDLVAWKNNENLAARIRFLESNQKIYQSYGGYWLILADAYYQNGEYGSCMKAVESYEALGSRLFRWDYEYARVLPLAIASAEQVYPGREYTDRAARWAGAIVENTQNKDWALRYFAAQTYVTLYGKTLDRSYLKKGYDIALDNANYLAQEQKALNAAFLSPVQETPVPKDATGQQKDQINRYNTLLRDARKAEIAPVSEPLRLNCDLLFDIATELELPETDRVRADALLHPDGARLFLNEALDDQYWFDLSKKPKTAPADMEFGGTSMVLPLRLLSPNAAITVQVQEKDAEQPVVISDWKLDRTERDTEGDISTFAAVYSSESAANHVWGPEASILISVNNPDLTPITFQYTTEGTKKAWYDYLKFWEGHKNRWYDYLKVWDNSVVFVRAD